MTIATNTFTRFDAIGVREQLSNVIYNVAPWETPFLTNAGVGKARNTLFEWQTDTLATAVSSNQQLEGDDLTSYTAVVPTVRLGNYTEIARKDVVISDTQEAVESAGRASEVAYQIAKLGKELKRDMETSLLANKAAAAGSNTVARDSGTIPGFIETNTKAVLQLCYTNGANISTVMVGGFNKQTFSGFPGVVELMANQGRSQATIIVAADTYVGDFGKLSVVPNRFMRTRDAIFLDWDMVQVNFLRPFKQSELSKTGDAKKRLLVVEYGLQVNNEKGCGIATDLSTS